MEIYHIYIYYQSLNFNLYISANYWWQSPNKGFVSSYVNVVPLVQLCAIFKTILLNYFFL